NMTQAVTLSAIDDNVAEGMHTGVITPAVTSADPSYAGLVTPAVTAAVTDNDAAGVLVSPGSPLTLAEGGANATITVQLTSQPTAAVTINASPDLQVVAVSSPLTFTPANWNTPQTITIDAADDWLVEASPHLGSIALTATSADAAYAGIAIAGVVANVTDNDSVGITVAAGALLLAEGGPDTTANIVLAAQPSAAVTIAVASIDAQLHTDQTTLTFSPANWSTPQTITIGAVDDALGEVSPHNGTLAFTVLSADATWNGAYVADITFAVTDNDGPPADVVAPTGAVVTVVDHWVSTPTNPVTFLVGTDAGSGIGTHRLQRRLATLANAECLPFGTWSNLGSANPVSPATDLTPASACVQYRLVVADLAGNVATSAASGIIKTDRTTPSGAIDALAAARGTVTLTGLANDATSDVFVTLAYAGRVDGSICIGAAAAAGRFACTWNTSALPDGAYTVTATLRDAAGNVGYATQSVAVRNTVATTPVRDVVAPVVPRDVEAPIVQRFSVPALTWGAYAVVRWKVTDNAAGPITYRVELRTTTPRGAWSTWRAPADDGGPSPRFIRLPKRGASTCFRVVASDVAGNTVTGASTCTTMPLDDRELARSSGWSTRASKFALNQTLLTSTKDGASLRTVIGANRGVSLVASTGPRAGTVKVFLGARLVRTISLHAKQPRYRAVIRIPGAVKPGMLRIVVVGRTGAVQLDGLVVTR
ncbi:MAG: hypothetical protein H7287_07770, partial [Thermoleophilia bacterium]|nr:hypothetical protein [Thermoleophilia bacterium]